MASKRARTLRRVVQYALSLGLAIWLLRYALRSISFEGLWERASEANVYWIVASLTLAVGSHVLRALRWNMLLAPLGYRPGLFRTFLAVMVAYLANILAPRMGEVSRCGFLQRKARVPMGTSFGTVVTERLIDFLALVALFGLVALMEFKELYQFFSENFQSPLDPEGAWPWALGFLGLLILVAILVRFRVKKRGWGKVASNVVFQRVRDFFRQLAEGFLSIRKLESPSAFWLATLGIWVLYFGMAYTVVLAFPPTANLGVGAGLSILVVGGLAMATPVQGGIGTYHIFVGALLLIYGIGKEDGIAFATILHSSQTLLLLVFGAGSFLIGLFLPRMHHDPEQQKNPNEIAGQESA